KSKTERRMRVHKSSTKPRNRSRTFIPRLETLESRLAPSVSEAFDTTPVGSLPADWSQWSSIAGGANFAVESSVANSAPNGLAVNAIYSTVAARAWPNAPQAADVQVSADVYLGSLIPGQ